MKELLYNIGDILKKSNINQYIVGYHDYFKSKVSYSLTAPNIQEQSSRCVGIYSRFKYEDRERYISMDIQGIDSLSKIINDFLRADKAVINLSTITDCQECKKEFLDIHEIIESKKSEVKVHTNVELVRKEIKQKILNSDGKLVSFDNCINETIVNSIAIQGDEYFHANNFIFSNSIYGAINISELSSLLDTTIENAIESLIGYELNSKSGYFLFSGQASSIIVHELLGHMFEGQRSWLFNGKIPYDKILTNFKLNVFDDPLYKDGLAYRTFDIFMNKPEKILLMDNGRLQRVISDNASSYRLECLAKLPISRLSNTIVIPNEESKLDKLLCDTSFVQVESIKHAVFNPESGVLDIIIQAAHLVNKSGNKLPLKSFTISMPVMNFFSCVINCSEKSALFHGRCKAYGSLLNYSTYAPDLLLKI